MIMIKIYLTKLFNNILKTKIIKRSGKNPILSYYSKREIEERLEITDL